MEGSHGAEVKRLRAKAKPLPPLGKPSRGQRAWSVEERLVGQQLSVLVRAIKVQALAERLRTGKTMDIGNPMQIIEDRVNRKTKVEVMRWLRDLAQVSEYVNPKWVGILRSLGDHAGLAKRDQWSRYQAQQAQCARLQFAGLVREPDPELPWRTLDAYDKAARAIVARVHKQCPWITF